MNELKNLFPTLENEILDKLSDEGTLMTFQEGDIILKHGQYIRSTILVLKGSVKVYREDDEGNEFLMYFLNPGQACAISIICATKAEKSQITAKAVEDTELLSIPFGKMTHWMETHRSWYEFVLETYRSRFEEVLQVIDSIAFKNLDERLEFYLKREYRQIQTPDIQLTHQQIANELNSSREVISRLLKKMEQRGMVQLHRAGITLTGILS